MSLPHISSFIVLMRQNYSLFALSMAADGSCRIQSASVIVDETGVRRRDRRGTEAVRWDALARVEIVTTDDGPWGEDFFWLLHGEGGGVCLGGPAPVTALLPSRTGRSARQRVFLEAATRFLSPPPWRHHA